MSMTKKYHKNAMQINQEKAQNSSSRMKSKEN